MRKRFFTKMAVAASLIATSMMLTSCEFMLAVLEGMAMASYSPYGYAPSYASTYTPVYGSGNYDYLLDPNYAWAQAQQEVAQMQAVEQQLMQQTIQQVERENEEEYWTMTGGQISREEWNAIKAQALMESQGQGGENTPLSSNEYHGELSPQQYEEMYRRFEKNVQDWFDGLTIGGVTSTDSQGNINGTVNSNHYTHGGTYTSAQMGLKNAQKEMKRIREEAAKYGVIIQQSKWETATAKY